jgi:hypothetical protein
VYFYFTSTDGAGYAAVLVKNGSALAGQDVQGAAAALSISPLVSSLVALKANESVTCGAFQTSGSTQRINTGLSERTFFGAARLY